MNLTCVLIRADDMPGTWVSWCPELDAVTQGENPMNAIGMLMEVISFVVGSDLRDGQWIRDESTGEDTFRRERVFHPARRGRLAKDDENWPTYERFVNHRGDWAAISTDELADGLDKLGFVHGNLEWRQVGGVPVVTSLDFYTESVYVDGVMFEVNTVQRQPRKTTVALRASALPSDPALLGDAVRGGLCRRLLDDEEIKSIVRRSNANV